MRQILAQHRHKLKQWEGLVLFAYDDADPPHRRRRIQPGDEVHGTLTIGYGHTGPDVFPGMTITEAEADQFLDHDLDRFEAIVDRSVRVKLTDAQFAALVSFCYNVGPGGRKPGDGFTTSTLLRVLNAGRYDDVPAQLMRWTSSKNPIHKQGLINRRAAECALWVEGSYVVTNTVEPKPVAAPAGKLEGAAKALGSAGLGAGGMVGIADALSQASDAAQQASFLARNGTTIGLICGGVILLTGIVIAYMTWRRSRG